MRPPEPHRQRLDLARLHLHAASPRAAWRHRLTDLGCENLTFKLNTNGRNFFRAHYCNRSVPCVTSWPSRNPSVFFPMPASEGPSDPGNMKLDADIHEWGVATGAILVRGV